MGTRHLIAVQADGRYGVAQYGQWDGYPSGQGVNVLEFLKETDLSEFAGKVRSTHFITTEDYPGIKKFGDDWMRHFPQLSRDAGAGVLKMVRDRPEGIWLRNSIDFAGDSLFCEYAYVIDLDTMTLEVFRGFNKEPVVEGERFHGAPVDKEGSEYTPVRFWKSWPLENLPSQEAFLAELEESDDE